MYRHNIVISYKIVAKQKVKGEKDKPMYEVQRAIKLSQLIHSARSTPVSVPSSANLSAHASCSSLETLSNMSSTSPPNYIPSGNTTTTTTIPNATSEGDVSSAQQQLLSPREYAGNAAMEKLHKVKCSFFVVDTGAEKESSTIEIVTQTAEECNVWLRKLEKMQRISMNLKRSNNNNNISSIELNSGNNNSTNNNGNNRNSTAIIGPTNAADSPVTRPLVATLDIPTRNPKCKHWLI